MKTPSKQKTFSKQERLNRIAEIIKRVYDRCLDQDVTAYTTKEMTSRELMEIYKLARGV